MLRFDLIPFACLNLFCLPDFVLFKHKWFHQLEMCIFLILPLLSFFSFEVHRVIKTGGRVHQTARVCPDTQRALRYFLVSCESVYFLSRICSYFLDFFYDLYFSDLVLDHVIKLVTVLYHAGAWVGGRLVSGRGARMREPPAVLEWHTLWKV